MRNLVLDFMKLIATWLGNYLLTTPIFNESMSEIFAISVSFNGWECDGDAPSVTLKGNYHAQKFDFWVVLNFQCYLMECSFTIETQTLYIAKFGLTL